MLMLARVPSIPDTGETEFGDGDEVGDYIKLEGWDGEGDGKEVKEGGDICIPVADSC